MLIYFVECFIMGFALGLSWASFATPVYLICCFAGWVWAEIELLKNPKEFDFWREVYARSCEIKKTKPKQTILRADGAKSDEALMRWHDGLHSLAAEYAMWGNGMALPNALFFIQNAFRELGKPPHRKHQQGRLFAVRVPDMR